MVCRAHWGLYHSGLTATMDVGARQSGFSCAKADTALIRYQGPTDFRIDLPPRLFANDSSSSKPLTLPIRTPFDRTDSLVALSTEAKKFF
jgi:hypothetical protein